VQMADMGQLDSIVGTQLVDSGWQTVAVVGHIDDHEQLDTHLELE